MTTLDAIFGRGTAVANPALVSLLNGMLRTQNQLRRRVARVGRRLDQHFDLADGYLDLGGEA